MTCNICGGSGVLVVDHKVKTHPNDPPGYKNCKCMLDRIFPTLVPYWIHSARPAAKNYYAGMYDTNTIMVTPEKNQSSILHTTFRAYHDKGHSSLIRRFTDEKELVDSIFEKDINNNPIDMPYQDSQRVLLRIGIHNRKHSLLSDTLCDYLKHRLDRGFSTWIIREKPMSDTSFEYSARLEYLLENFTPIILK